MPDESLSFFTRVWLAWVCYFRIVFDGAFAKRVLAAKASTALPSPSTAPSPPTTPSPSVSNASALQLLALFQREGRLVDFLEQDVAAFPDADIGAAARAVHEGCRKALRAHATIEPIRAEAEETKLTLALGFSAAEIKLTGNVRGEPPYTGTLKHRGWRAKSLRLPTATEGHDATIVAPAEVELA